jgi:SapC
MAVNGDRLKKLSGEKLAELVQANELELIYIHLQSLRNISVMSDRLSGSLTADGQAQSAGESTAQASPDAADTGTDNGKKKRLAAQAT